MGGCDGLERTEFLTVSTLGGCCGLERTDFLHFLLWAGSGGHLKRIDFEQFLLWEGVVVLDRHAGQHINMQGCWIDVEACNTWGCPNRRRVPTSTIPIQIPHEHADAEGSIGDIQGALGASECNENIQGVPTEVYMNSLKLL